MTGTEFRFWKYATGWRPDVCWDWEGARDRFGYGLLKAGDRGAVYRRAHRISYELFHGPIPAGMVVRHKCDRKCCVNPYHLEIGTHKQNTRDAYERGLRPTTCSGCGVAYSKRTPGCDTCSRRHRKRVRRSPDEAISFPNAGEGTWITRRIREAT